MNPSFTPSKVYSPNPKTTRSFASPFISSPDGKWLMYSIKKTVILRSLDDLSCAKAFTKHSNMVTAVAFHPMNKLAASADEKGIIYIWYIDDCTDSKKIEDVFSGKINGLEFSPDGDKLLIYGQGSGIFAKCINWDMKTECGEFFNNSRSVLSGKFNKKRPFKVLLGGEDMFVNLYVGVPFKQTQMVKKHDNFIASISLSPNGEKWISTGFDKKIITYNTDNAEVIDEFDSTKIENGHKMTIISSCFLDDDKLITASLDKTVKIWSLSEKKVLYTLVPEEKLGVPNMMCGVVTNGKVIVAVTLNGNINVWKCDNLSDNKLPDQVILGHQDSINKMIYSKVNKEIISGDFTGKIVLFNENGTQRQILKPDLNRKVSSLSLSNKEDILYASYGNGLITSYNMNNLEVKFELKDISEDPKTVYPSKTDDNIIYVLFYDTICIINDGKVEKKNKLKNYEGMTMTVNEEEKEILIGDKKGKLHILDYDLNEKSNKEIHFGEYSIMKLSPDNKYIASGDNQRTILVYDAKSKEIICDRFGFHSAKIFDLDWSSDSNFIVSGSLDGAVMVWNLEKKSRFKYFINVDGDQINAVSFTNEDKDVICAGGACVINQISLS